ncbi:MAG: hypothetical protein ABIR79_13500 [Candidatus Binatia bacterium]
MALPARTNIGIPRHDTIALDLAEGLVQSFRMVSPRLRPAVPLPTPVDYTRLRQVLAVKIVATLALWALPLLLLPAPWFPTFGIPEPSLESIIFVRLLGAAYVALVSGYALAWQAPARHPGAILVGIVSNGLASLMIVNVGAQGGFGTWPMLGTAYMWSSALLTAGLAAALAKTGQPLLRRLAERQRPGSMKVV